MGVVARTSPSTLHSTVSLGVDCKLSLSTVKRLHTPTDDFKELAHDGRAHKGDTSKNTADHGYCRERPGRGT